MSSIGDMTKRAKLIHLNRHTIRAIDIEAAKQGSNFKNYVERLIEAHVDKQTHTSTN